VQTFLNFLCRTVRNLFRDVLVELLFRTVTSNKKRKRMARIPLFLCSFRIELQTASCEFRFDVGGSREIFQKALLRPRTKSRFLFVRCGRFSCGISQCRFVRHTLPSCEYNSRPCRSFSLVWSRSSFASCAPTGKTQRCGLGMIAARLHENSGGRTRFWQKRSRAMRGRSPNRTKLHRSFLSVEEDKTTASNIPEFQRRSF